MTYRVTAEEFDLLVADALSRLPAWLMDQLTASNIDIVTQSELSHDKRLELGMEPYEGLLGLYEGIPLDQRTGYGDVVPDKITLFQREIESASSSRDELLDQIETTLKHEIHHWHGADEDRVHDFGLG